jgi:hypothetical protein
MKMDDMVELLAFSQRNLGRAEQSAEHWEARARELQRELDDTRNRLHYAEQDRDSYKEQLKRIDEGRVRTPEVDAIKRLMVACLGTAPIASPIGAVKAIRELTGLGLREAKDILDDVYVPRLPASTGERV